MEILAPVTLDGVVAVWLGAEIRSDRFGATVRGLLRREGQPRALLTSPDLTDEQANATRRDLLREYRGFDQADTSIETYLGGVPAAPSWRVSYWPWLEQRALRQMGGLPAQAHEGR